MHSEETKKKLSEKRRQYYQNHPEAREESSKRFKKQWAENRDNFLEFAKTGASAGGKALHCSEESMEKVKSTNLERYGVDNPMQCVAIQEKLKHSNIEQYGVENAFQREDVKQKIKEHWQHKEGITHVSQSGPIKRKKEQTCLENFGFKNNLSNPDQRYKIRNTMLEKYGVEYPLQNDSIKQKVAETVKQNNGKGLILYPESTVKSIKEYRSEHNVSDVAVADALGLLSASAVSKYLRKMGFLPGNITQPELQVINIIHEIDPELQISVHDRNVIKPLEIDVYLPTSKVGIEVHGSYWHNETKIPKEYHQQKFLAAENNGIRLIQIFDYELQNKRHLAILSSMINSAIGNNKCIGARNCDVKPISAINSSQFYSDNHWQGSRGASFHYALFYKQVPVAVMSIGKSRFEKNVWELIRFATKLNISVQGGASKLLKRIIQDHPEIKTLVSYSDNRLFTGRSYQHLGFEKVDASYLDYVWWKEPYEYHFRYQCQKHKLQKLLGDNFDPRETEVQNMQRNGYSRLFGAGQTKWIHRR